MNKQQITDLIEQEVAQESQLLQTATEYSYSAATILFSNVKKKIQSSYTIDEELLNDVLTDMKYDIRKELHTQSRLS
ncbi:MULTISPECIES: hypothetical protein [Flammeovirga]|uniref:Uncharacterized protein n=1 Tax=Flammeovirga agarivorans TaxID=2726742 RepID=A0A7X8SN72_9BACT|nr:MULTISPECIES: hypothetical protein [Flammeovirga]NLR93296.1 hypothetical protein [Flammeovirga agarivorans]